MWGQFFWNLLHNISTMYPDNPSETDKRMFQMLLDSYQCLLPCNTCKTHFTKNLLDFPITTYIEKNKNYSSSKNGIVLWGIKMHNKVNKMLMKFISVTDDQIGVDYTIKRYGNLDTSILLRNVFKYALDAISGTDRFNGNAFLNLFNSVAYFSSRKNIDLIKKLKNKNVSIKFEKQKDVAEIMNAL